MDDQDLEKMLVQTLRLAKENNEYIKRIDSRQKFARNINRTGEKMSIAAQAVAVLALIQSYPCASR